MRLTFYGLWLLPILATLSGAAPRGETPEVETGLVRYGFSPREKRSVGLDEIRFELLIAFCVLGFEIEDFF